jgi:hypothetical protein
LTNEIPKSIQDCLRWAADTVEFIQFTTSGEEEVASVKRVLGRLEEVIEVHGTG